MNQTFTKTERLTSKKLINRLFDRNAKGSEAPQSVYAHPFRVMYLLPELAQPLADVPKSAGPANQDAPASVDTTEASSVMPSESLPQVLFSVPKRTFKKAVDRNLVRRRCREAYRLNKRILQDKKAFVRPVAITFLYTAKTKISFDEIDKGMKLALKRMNNVK